MPHYRIRFHASTGLADEHVDAERLDHEAGGWLVFRATVLVIGAPREVVVRRVAAAPVRQVTQVVWTTPATRPGASLERVSYVAINVLSVPEGAGATLEERFAARQGAVDRAPGFEHFELLRPLEGTSDYLVYTRWRSEDDFVAWRSSQAFGQGHAQASGRPAGERPAATGSTIWAFEVAQESSAPA